MKRKVIICCMFFITIIALFENVSNALVFRANYTTVDFKNVNSDNDDIFVLINLNIDEENKPNNDLEVKIKNNLEDELKKTIGLNFIEEQYKSGKYIKGLEDTHEELIYNNKKYKKIKVTGDCSITFHDTYYKDSIKKESRYKEVSPVLIAKLYNDNVRIIVNDYEKYDEKMDTTEIKDILGLKFYKIDREGYGGDFVNRRFIEYDAKTNKVKDNTEERIKVEEKKIQRYVVLPAKLKQARPFIIMGLCFLWLIGLLIVSIIKKRKKKKSTQ